MPKVYSTDLRVRVVEAMRASETHRTVAASFDIAPSIAGKWHRPFRNGAPKSSKRQNGGVVAPHLAVLSDRPDAARIALGGLVDQRALRIQLEPIRRRGIESHFVAGKPGFERRMCQDFPHAMQQESFSICLILPADYTNMSTNIACLIRPVRSDGNRIAIRIATA